MIAENPELSVLRNNLVKEKNVWICFVSLLILTMKADNYFNQLVSLSEFISQRETLIFYHFFKRM